MRKFVIDVDIVITHRTWNILYMYKYKKNAFYTFFCKMRTSNKWKLADFGGFAPRLPLDDPSCRTLFVRPADFNSLKNFCIRRCFFSLEVCS